jgi:hypothetical protein
MATGGHRSALRVYLDRPDVRSARVSCSAHDALVGGIVMGTTLRERPFVFVRWKRRILRRRRDWFPPGEQALSAALVETRRVDGKPRQRIVRYLATIKGGQLVYPPSTDRFWQDVDRTLADMDLDDEQRQTIGARIATTVPRPDPAVVEPHRIEVKALATAIAVMCQGRGRPTRRMAAGPGELR